MKNLRLLILVHPLYLLLITAQSFFSFSIDRSEPDPEYTNRIRQWHQQRVESLKQENGWLNVAGLFWLREGENTFGSAGSNDVVFPEGKIAPVAGTFTLHSGEVKLVTAPDADVWHENTRITEKEIFAKDAETPPVLHHGSLRWVVIKRGDRYGVRLRDLESPALKQFRGIETFPIDSAWRIRARLVKPAVPTTIPITNVLGQTTPQPSQGRLVFTVQGKEYQLDAVGEGKQLFILFADKTNGDATYGSGRFLYADLPNAQGNTYLDFNQAINPPCAFTPYATCPLPPKQNALPIAIPAGEKAYQSEP